ncbi:homoserine dehydrogenase [Caldalkalibacillus salinus]|uniref:homoserine dehydrogenase n=1 Tax=Caldalkalibacillus salinus TaxID=2803787 RepID=UPI001924B2DB|nr:homoserine dehydrogenase [Caldalkalibacillus salinus]
MEHKLALIGFGTVGQGFAEILEQRQGWLAEETGINCKIVAISDTHKGSVYHPDGLDIQTLLKLVQREGTVDSYPQKEGLIRGLNSIQTIQQTNAQTIIEVAYTDVKTGQPAIAHCETAFEAGKHVVMSNKGPVALAYQSLSQLAQANDVRWGFEGTVMSGTPALRMPITSLAGNRIKRIRGILNGTTNYILTRMEEGLAYDEALTEAQERGYAEADPTSDVEGYDVMYKVMILAQVVLGHAITADDVHVSGLSGMTLKDIKNAAEKGKRLKLLADLMVEDGEINASVQLVEVDREDPLAAIMGPKNAITYTCDMSGDVTLVGAGAGKKETGYALFIDLLNILRDQI